MFPAEVLPNPPMLHINPEQIESMLAHTSIDLETSPDGRPVGEETTIFDLLKLYAPFPSYPPVDCHVAFVTVPLFPKEE